MRWKNVTNIHIINFHLIFLMETEIFRPKWKTEKHEEDNVYFSQLFFRHAYLSVNLQSWNQTPLNLVLFCAYGFDFCLYLSKSNSE